MRLPWVPAAALLAAAVFCVPARAEMSAEELAKPAQNPVGNLISLPFQNNTNFNFGPEKGTQNILNIQPVYPVHVNADVGPRPPCVQQRADPFISESSR